MDPYVLMLQTDADDKYITESTLAEIGATVPVQFLARLDELDSFIAGSGEPGVILISDQGAGQHGKKLVKELKSNPRYGHIPVVILGEVTTEDYIRECYRAGANTFITKPSTVAATKKKIQTFLAYWFDVAEV